MTSATMDRTADSYASLGPTASAATSRLKGIVPWVAIVLLGALALVAVGLRGTPEERLLDPRSPAPVGSKAIAEVLRAHDVAVRVVTSLAEVPAEIPSGTTVVVTADERLSPSGITELAERARGADQLVVLLAQPEVVQEVAPELRGYPMPPYAQSAAAAGCTVTALRPGDVVTGATVSMLAAGDSDAELCLPVDYGDGSMLLAALPADEHRPRTLLVGFAAALTNERITAEDNAAVALRMLGQSAELLWLIPSGADGPDGGAGDSYSPWPAWSTPVAVVLALGTVLFAIVRGRRLGRLATEPLPVTVRAAETTESRGHLYRRSRDLARTAAILRAGTRGRLQRRLGVARTDPLDTLVTAVVAATGEPRERIQTLLADTEPATTRDLVRLGTDLADLERKVRLT